MRRASCFFLLFCLFALTSSAQQLKSRVTNQDVIEMVSLGLSDAVIIDKIHASPSTDFDTSVAGLRALKAAKVSDAVLQAMINPRPGVAAVDQVGAKPSPAASGSIPDEAGVYVLRDGVFSEVDPEIVGWQTGGMAKMVATLFIDKGHVNGKIMGPRSTLRLSCPLEFLIKTVEGTSVTEYQLLKLYQKGGRREFRAMTGGVLHASGGAERTNVSFMPEKIGNRTWRIRLYTLSVGEYGFLPPGVSAASISASGKMYTFSVGEEGARAPPDRSRSRTAAALAPNGQAFPEASIGAVPDAKYSTVTHDGVTMTHVVPGGPADLAGIKSGDVILSIEDHYLFTGDEFRNEVQRHQPGTRIAIRYRRYATISETYVVVGSLPEEGSGDKHTANDH